MEKDGPGAARTGRAHARRTRIVPGPAVTRCPWADSSDLMRAYHDEEWGVPLHDDRRLFEFLVLEGAQAGLSWLTILSKRPAYRKAFKRFDVAGVARLTGRDVTRLLANSGIVRNRAKIESAIVNARCVLEIQQEYRTLDRYLWGFVGGRPIRHRFRSQTEIPVTTPESEALSRDLRGRGFRFVGPTICYAFMQAVGMVNDHVTGCFRHKDVTRPRPASRRP